MFYVELYSHVHDAFKLPNLAISIFIYNVEYNWYIWVNIIIIASFIQSHSSLPNFSFKKEKPHFW